MKEIKCPFCGRENTRGKYCMFCGNPLAGGQAAGGGNDSARKREEGERWDPEKAYAQSRGRMIALAAAAVILIACIGVVLAVQPRPAGVSNRAFAAPLGTPGASSLQEMTRMLKDAGMKTIGNPYDFNDITYQQFAPFVILNEETDYSIAAVQRETEIAVSHSFTEKSGGTYTLSKPGPVFEALLEKLTKKFGKPVIRGTQDYYYWKKDGSMLVLYYGYNNVIRLEFHEDIPDASV